MRLLQKVLVLPLAFLTALSSSAIAQQRHVVDATALSAALNRHDAAERADRAALREALARPEVRELAARMGMDLERVNSTVATLAGAELERAAAAARQVNESLAGGASTVTISTTTIIIALLVIILLILALK